MKIWVKLIKTIENTGSTNLKMSLLEDFIKSNEDCLEILQALFNLQLNYKINTFLSDVNKLESKFMITLLSNIDSSDCGSTSYFLNEIYNKIINNYRFKKSEWLKVLNTLSIKCSSKEELEIYLNCITRSLTIGIAGKNYNKVASKLNISEIEKFDCMRCSNVEDSKVDYSNAYVSIKKDGVNISVFENKFFTRNGGQLILPNMEEEIFAVFKDYAIFAEIVSTTRQATSGIVNSALKMGLDSKVPVDTLKLHIFDILPLENFKNKDFANFPFHKRLKILNSFSDGVNYEILKHTKVSSLDEVLEWNNHYYNLGEEGIICNDAKGLFEFKRSKFRCRFKAEIENEFTIVGFQKHSKKDNWLGSFIVESEDGKIRSNVGSGFSEYEREEYFNNLNEYLGKICTIKYNSIDKKTNSLFLPVWKALRLDKEKADILKIQ